jgi:L-lactate dehydrogenase complex protein LldF
VHAAPWRYRAYTWLATRLRSVMPKKQLGWTVHRIALQPAKQSLHERMAARRSAG